MLQGLAGLHTKGLGREHGAGARGAAGRAQLGAAGFVAGVLILTLSAFFDRIGFVFGLRPVLGPNTTALEESQKGQNGNKGSHALMIGVVGVDTMVSNARCGTFGVSIPLYQQGVAVVKAFCVLYNSSRLGELLGLWVLTGA